MVDRLAHRRDERDEPHLAALAGDAQALRGRQVGAGQAERFGNAKARAIEQREHGEVARGNPGLGVRLGLGFVQDVFGGLYRDRAGQARRAAGALQVADLGILEAMRAAHPAVECLDRRQQPRNRGVRQAVAAARGEIGADVARLEAGERLEARLGTKVQAQEPEEHREVRAIGLDRLGRHAALVAEMREKGGQDVHVPSLDCLP